MLFLQILARMARRFPTNPIVAMCIASDASLGNSSLYFGNPMRLTLRTLLAYMDDILDSRDQDDLARQVDESEKATELIHRTRDAMRRLRLGAPPVMGDGMDLDPNATAEYLDNTMPADDMTEYQQVCLDSDVHLAEVASCHHILTMVLGEPAEIDPEMRERMYKVPDRVDEWRKLRVDVPHAMSTAGSAVSTPAAAAIGAPQSDSKEELTKEVPDYLAASESSGVGRLALAFAAALLLGAGAFFAFGPDGFLVQGDQLADGELASGGEANMAGDAQANVADGDEPLGGEPSNNDLAATDSTVVPDDTIGEATPADPPTELAEQGADSPSTDELTADAGETGDEVDTVAENSDSAMPELPPVAVDDSAAAAVGNEADSSVVENVAEAAGEEGLASGEAPAMTDYGANDTAALTETGELMDSSTDVVIPGVNGPSAPSGDATADVATGEGAGAEDAVADVGVEPSRPAVAPLGTSTAPKQVLLRWSESDGAWLRLPPRASIQSGYRLLSLPTYRPTLALVPGLRVEFSDGAMLMVDYAGDGQTLKLDITYGRVLLQNTGMESVEAELVVAGESTRVALESTAVLGLDVDRPFVAGADVEESIGSFLAKFYAPMGMVAWQGAAGTFDVTGPSQWLWGDAEAVSLTDEVDWLDGQSLDYLEQNLSSNIERRFGTDRPARQQLLGFYENSRRREEKSLAAVCGTHVGQFVPFVQALADSQQQSNWDEHIEQLRAAMSRSTQAARLIHQTLTEQRGAALADDLFNMLRGYTPQQIGQTPEEVKRGVTRQLIDWLEHDRLEYRVLAIYNLRKIYGGKTLSYNPVKTEPSRQERAVRQWRQRLAENELTPQL